MVATLGRYENLFANAITVRPVSALAAADAMFALNHDAKFDSEAYACRYQIYTLKASLLEALERSGYCVRAVVDERDNDWLWLLTFVIHDWRYDWHLPPDQADWLIARDGPLPETWRWPSRRTGGTLQGRMATIRRYLRMNGVTR